MIRKVIAIVILFLLFISIYTPNLVMISKAQEPKVIKWMLIPQIFIPAENTYVWKYLNEWDRPWLWSENSNNGMSGMELGTEGYYIAIGKFEQTVFDSLSLASDVILFPTNIDQTLTPGEANFAKTAFENRHIPANWIQPNNTTYRQILKYIAGVCFIKQKFEESGRSLGFVREKMNDAGVTLDTQYKDFPNKMKNILNKLADDNGYDKSQFTANSKMRDIIDFLVFQFGDVSITLLETNLR